MLNNFKAKILDDRSDIANRNRLEAIDNFRYLQTLKIHFENLVDSTKDFTALFELFLPMELR